MSELKARHIVDVYDSYYAENPFGERSQVYLKSEADKVIAELEESNKMEVGQLLMEIAELKKQVHDYAQGLYVIQAKAEKEARHQKYKRCMAMAEWCHNQREIYERDSYNWELEDDAVNSLRKKANIMRKWKKRWLKIAEQFKETK